MPITITDNNNPKNNIEYNQCFVLFRQTARHPRVVPTKIRDFEMNNKCFFQHTHAQLTDLHRNMYRSAQAFNIVAKQYVDLLKQNATNRKTIKISINPVYKQCMQTAHPICQSYFEKQMTLGQTQSCYIIDTNNNNALYYMPGLSYIELSSVNKCTWNAKSKYMTYWKHIHGHDHRTDNIDTGNDQNVDKTTILLPKLFDKMNQEFEMSIQQMTQQVQSLFQEEASAVYMTLQQQLADTEEDVEQINKQLKKIGRRINKTNTDTIKRQQLQSQQKYLQECKQSGEINIYYYQVECAHIATKLNEFKDVNDKLPTNKPKKDKDWTEKVRAHKSTLTYRRDDNIYLPGQLLMRYDSICRFKDYLIYFYVWRFRAMILKHFNQGIRACRVRQSLIMISMITTNQLIQLINQENKI